MLKLEFAGLDEGRFYRIPKSIDLSSDIKELIETLTINHVYYYKKEPTPYLGVVDSILELRTKFEEVKALGGKVIGFNWHCASVVHIEDTDNYTIALSFKCRLPGKKYFANLDFILGFSEEKRNLEYLSETEVKDVLALIELVFCSPVRRVTSLSSIWGNFNPEETQEI
ncbi:MAG: hypothetical protein ACMG57_01315 [Candidatus Dojkabacteria bacterium]